MESFSARFCGACGAGASGDDYTPCFDRLAADGVLFDRCFSAGTHTHHVCVHACACVCARALARAGHTRGAHPQTDALQAVAQHPTHTCLTATMQRMIVHV